VTFKDLQKLVQSQSGLEQSQLLQRLRDKPFRIWDQKQHKLEDIRTKGDCCFNHIIRLPKKENKEKPMFDYEKFLYDSLLVPDFYNPLQHTFKHKDFVFRYFDTEIGFSTYDLTKFSLAYTNGSRLCPSNSCIFQFFLYFT
jgi:hypothetical protein